MERLSLERALLAAGTLCLRLQSSAEERLVGNEPLTESYEEFVVPGDKPLYSSVQPKADGAWGIFLWATSGRAMRVFLRNSTVLLGRWGIFDSKGKGCDRFS